MPESSIEFDRELQVLEAELKKLEAEYNMFFGGRLPRPPWETRSRVDSLVKRLDRQHASESYGDRFRFSTLQARYVKFIDLWDRGLRAREEGRPGPFMHQGLISETPRSPEFKPLEIAPPQERAAKPAVKQTSFSDPALETEKLRDLYKSLSEARAAVGQDKISFGKFTALVKKQVAEMKQKGSSEVVFRVAVADGKVAFTARSSKGGKEK